MSEYMQKPDIDRAAVLIFATRYALGRRTYAPRIVQSQFVVQQKVLSPNDVDVLIRDIQAQGESGYGDRCDEETWLDVLDWLREMRPIIERATAVAEPQP